MSKRSSRKRPLQDHRQVGKRFIPPLADLGNVVEARWADLALPELAWLALMCRSLGLKMAVEVAVGLAEASISHFSEEKLPLLSATSAYSLLDDQAKNSLLRELAKREIHEPLSVALSPLATLYPECPLNFLSSHCMETEDALLAMNLVVSQILDKTSTLATHAQAISVYIGLVTGKHHVFKGSGIEKLPEIVHYPHTDDSRMVAGMVRTFTNMLSTMEESTATSGWAQYFWNRGLEIEECELIG